MKKVLLVLAVLFGVFVICGLLGLWDIDHFDVPLEKKEPGDRLVEFEMAAGAPFDVLAFIGMTLEEVLEDLTASGLTRVKNWLENGLLKVDLPFKPFDHVVLGFNGNGESCDWVSVEFEYGLSLAKMMWWCGLDYMLEVTPSERFDDLITWYSGLPEGVTTINVFDEYNDFRDDQGEGIVVDQQGVEIRAKPWEAELRKQFE